MDLNLQKEEFSKAFVRAIASVAGVGCSFPEIDDDSIDVEFTMKKEFEVYRSPHLEAQLKCTAQDLVREDSIHFPLKKKNYDDLSAKKVAVPRILICILVPSDNPQTWIEQSEENLSLMKCGYWLNLKGMEGNDNSQSVTVKIPLSQTFTVQSFGEMFKCIGDGGQL